MVKETPLSILVFVVCVCVRKRVRCAQLTRKLSHARLSAHSVNWTRCSDALLLI